MNARRALSLAVSLAATLVLAASAHAIPASITQSVTNTKGMVILIHGGGWRASQNISLSLMQPAAAAFRARGWSTRIQAQHGGLQSYVDVLNAAIRYKKTIGKRPLCLYGESAGGQLAALTAAALGSQIKCVMASAAPLWLDYDRDTSDHAHVRDLAVGAFGEPNLRQYSPLTYAAAVKANVLLSYAVNDPLIPSWHAPFFDYSNALTKTTSISPGPVRWIHSDVSAASLEHSSRALFSFFARQG